MFNLEDSIDQWLRNFYGHRAFDHGSIREMELHLRDHIEDLMAEGHDEKEAFQLAVADFGEIPKMAKEEFWNQRRKTTIKTLIYTAMIKNFYFTTIRNLLKHKSYFLINILGLAVGMASFTFISLYIFNELSYDRFHANHENIYGVRTESVIRGQLRNGATVAAPMARSMMDNYPEVVRTTRVLRSGALLVDNGNEKINESQILFADSGFFSVFDFRLLKGNPRTALQHPKSIILTEDYVRKYFGDQDPMGQKIVIEDTVFYSVTGVLENVPPNSHIQFSMLGSLNTKPINNTNHWIGTDLYTYAVLKEKTKTDELEGKMKQIFYDHIAPEIEYYTGMTIDDWEKAGNSVGFNLMPIKDIHLYSIATGELEPTGNITYIHAYALIGVIILFIAIFNFINLATAHSATRAKEVGIRKVVGSTKRNLIFQFILESVVLSLMACALAFVITIASMPSFIGLIGNDLAFDITSNYIAWLAMAGLAIVVGILAGSYPSFVLSRFQPVEVLKGNFSSPGRSGWLRNLLVTLQFSASIVIIAGTIVVYSQIDYMLVKNLGFDKEQILVIERPDWLNNNLEVFKNELLKNPNISSVANSETIPGKIYGTRSYRKNNNNEVYLFKNNQVSYEHKELLGFEISAGRFFSKEFASDSNAVVLNESAAKSLGIDEPLGAHLITPWKKGQLLTIIGIVKDYNIESLHNSVAPVLLELAPNNNGGYVSVKMQNSKNIRETVTFVENAWLRHSNDKPFDYFFFDEDYQNLYKSESTTGQMFVLFATLSIFIACLGLIGLVTYTASIRRKEIGIRKILGAGTSTLVRLLSTQIARLIIFATIVSWPLVYFVTDYWLRNFADRTTVGLWVYLSSTLAIVAIVGVAVSFQTIKTTMSNPMESLRQD
ncbi:MAG: ABC transporter permease [Reichenbachiella sp.]|uniref:ABC transporter permease n=1 Tax=Reichenbachiella sp. TaxID=2184521 RepID=UPI0032630954